jgi:hypothetical protein
MRIQMAVFDKIKKEAELWVAAGAMRLSVLVSRDVVFVSYIVYELGYA